MSRILVAKTNAMIKYKGRRVVLKKGITTAREGHDVVKEHPELWEAQKVNFETKADPEPVKETKPVETTTAVPGERRTVSPSAAPTRRGRRSASTSKGDGDK